MYFTRLGLTLSFSVMSLLFGSLDVHAAALKNESVQTTQTQSELLRQLQSEDPLVRSSASLKILSLGDQSIVNSLIKRVQHPNKEVRREVLYLINILGSTENSALFIDALQDTDSSVREVAANSLGHMGDQRAVLPLIQRIEQEEHESVKVKAIQSLGLLKNKRALKPLTQILKDETPVLKAVSASALGKIGDASSVLPLIRALQDTHSTVQIAAVVSLGELQDKRAVGPLLMVFEKSDNKLLKQYTVVSLGKIKDPSVFPLMKKLISQNDFRFEAVEAIGNLGDKSAVPLLLQVLREEAWPMDYHVTRALLKLGDNSGLADIRQALQHSEPYVRVSAANALTEFRDTSAVKAIAEAINTENDPAVKQAMQEAIKELSD